MWRLRYCVVGVRVVCGQFGMCTGCVHVGSVMPCTCSEVMYGPELEQPVPAFDGSSDVPMPESTLSEAQEPRTLEDLLQQLGGVDDFDGEGDDWLDDFVVFPDAV
jgi:hypothetical protein